MEISEQMNAVPGLLFLKDTFCGVLVPWSAGSFQGES